MQIIINVPDNDLINHWDNEDVETVKSYFESDTIFSNYVLDCLSEVIPETSEVSITGFDDAKEALKDNLKKILIEEINSELNW